MSKRGISLLWLQFPVAVETPFGAAISDELEFVLIRELIREHPKYVRSKSGTTIELWIRLLNTAFVITTLWCENILPRSNSIVGWSCNSSRMITQSLDSLLPKVSTFTLSHSRTLFYMPGSNWAFSTLSQRVRYDGRQKPSLIKWLYPFTPVAQRIWRAFFTVYLSISSLLTWSWESKYQFDVIYIKKNALARCVLDPKAHWSWNALLHQLH